MPEGEAFQVIACDWQARCAEALLAALETPLKGGLHVLLACAISLMESWNCWFCHSFGVFVPVLWFCPYYSYLH